MSGFSSPIGIQKINPWLEIVVEEHTYSIGRWDFPKPDDEVLEMLTDEILNVFDALRREIIHTQSVKLESGFCRDRLVKLAEWGRTAYQAFFGDEKPNQILSGRLKPNTAPTFVSNLTPFPWEVLFEGSESDYERGTPEMFWGFRYTPARILNPEKDITDYVSEQTPESDMLFCLHHKLLCCCQKERPAIEKLVKVKPQDRFRVLGSACNLGVGVEQLMGDHLLKYLYKARHNMLHFACHCRESQRGDSLMVSFLKDDEITDTIKEIELETYKFFLRKGQFIGQPLVFLNACQSAGGVDDLRRTFNLPKVFIERGAAAVIATACPVPDLFAAEFAQVFYKLFLRGQEIYNEEAEGKSIKLMTIGEALRATRWHFLKECNNPLGLAYGLYSPAHYQVAQSLQLR